MNNQICEKVSEVVCAALVSGSIPWKDPEFIKEPAANKDGRPYSLVNQFLLGKGGRWVTFKQAGACGGRVKKGEKAKFVIFWSMIEKYKKDEKGEKVLDKDGNPIVIERIPYLKWYSVFHESQCENLNLKKIENEVDGIKDGDEIIGLYMANNPTLKINNVDEKTACYNVNDDSITIPKIGKYVHKEDYYAAAFHEMIHSTGHPSRLNRMNGKDSAAYNDDTSIEELVAEIGSAVLMNKCGIETVETQEATTSYVQKWLEAIKHDHGMVVIATGRAEKAINYVLGNK